MYIDLYIIQLPHKMKMKFIHGNWPGLLTQKMKLKAINNVFIHVMAGVDCRLDSILPAILEICKRLRWTQENQTSSEYRQKNINICLTGTGSVLKWC